VRPFTLLVDLDGILTCSKWDKTHGWRTAKRPGADYFIAYVSPQVVQQASERPTDFFPFLAFSYLSQFYEIVLFTAQPAMVSPFSYFSLVPPRSSYSLSSLPLRRTLLLSPRSLTLTPPTCHTDFTATLPASTLPLIPPSKTSPPLTETFQRSSCSTPTNRTRPTSLTTRSFFRNGRESRETKDWSPSFPSWNVSLLLLLISLVLLACCNFQDA
jgi:hypothetical protein